MGYYIIDYTKNFRSEVPIDDAELLLETIKVLFTNKLLELGLYKYATRIHDIMNYDLQEVASNIYHKVALIGRKGRIDDEFTFPYMIFENEFMKMYYGDSEVYDDRAIIIELYDLRKKKKILEIHTNIGNFMFKNLFDSIFPKEVQRKRYEFKIRTEI